MRFVSGHTRRVFGVLPIEDEKSVNLNIKPLFLKFSVPTEVAKKKIMEN